MAKFSFDIVSEVNFQEVDNAINQSQRELSQRYDFKGSKCSIDYNKEERKITLVADDDYKLRALKDMLTGRMTKRGISLKALNFQEAEKAFEGTLRQNVEITSGIPTDKAKELNKIIKELKLKVNTQVEGDKIRVMSQKKDELQEVIQHLKGINFSLDLNFTNFR